MHAGRCGGLLLHLHASILEPWQAAVFFQITKPGRASSASQPLRSGPRGRRRSIHASSAATSPGPTLPHAIAVRGELSGVVYTAPMSAWRRADTVANWPPTCEPPQPFCAWEASLAQGTLVLRPIVPPPGSKPPSPGRNGAAKQLGAAEGAGAAGSSRQLQAAGSEAAAASGSGAANPGAPAAPTPAPAKVGIPLEGCTVELVGDGLQGRSAWIRRAPLLVQHPKWNLLDGEPAFYLWAGGLRPRNPFVRLHAAGGARVGPAAGRSCHGLAGWGLGAISAGFAAPAQHAVCNVHMRDACEATHIVPARSQHAC